MTTRKFKKDEELDDSSVKKEEVFLCNVESMVISVAHKKIVDDLFSKLLESLKERNTSPQDLSVVSKAFNIAYQAHSTQFRKSGEPYIIHPVNVALILVDLDCDIQTICAGLLHDVVEDTDVLPCDIEDDFCIEVRAIVEGVTKLNKLSFASKREEQAENFRKMILAIASDLRVVLVKLADRLHNMKTLEFMSEKKQKEIATETLEIFAPLANRFGLGHIKWQLEDLSFRYLDEFAYRGIENIVKDNRSKREEYLSKIIQLIQEEIDRSDLNAQISGRVKHFYSIYSKLKRLQTDEIFDLLALRIIVEKERQCYEVLGIIHDMFSPIPGRFKDYIAIPKSNMYQSLHTTVIGLEERLVEIQIRTAEMHKIAEFGVAAHWKYKEKGSISSASKYDLELSGLRQKLVEMQNELPDAGDYSNAVQIDFLADEIFVLSPKGDVYRLPRESTPVDFAYHVHSEIGDKCVGAKVNERIVTLDRPLKNGDIVEISTNKNAHPSSAWLSFVKSSSTKSKIKSWFKKNRRDEYISLGKSLLLDSLGKSSFEELLKNNSLKKISQKLNLNSEEELFLRLASGDISTTQIIGRLRNEGLLQKEEASSVDSSLIPKKSKFRKSTVGEIQSLKNLMHSFAKCCQPIPGESIIGVITRGRGAIVHREDCPNLKGLDERRLISISWDANSTGSAKFGFPTTLDVECIDRVGISRDVLDKIANEKINILDIRVITRPTRQTAIVRVSVEIIDIKSLNGLIASISRLSDVLAVKRHTLKSPGRRSPKPSV
ncbi:MAG TPA: bifunctional (p)ppGpp synthetase/guanosine-3',5'-bis(diphosphate) 3'-pyrophosphohydrolase [Vampirovibrionales bacterium]